MFYSSIAKVIDTHSTYLDTKRVFTGHYWDEFALTGALAPDGAKVLMLGLSLGGGIRPILASNRSFELTAVDRDADTVARCDRFYNQHFPDLKFKAIAADALEFVQTTRETFDVIWLDIYLESGYSPLYFEPKFFEQILRCLSSSGVLLVNSFGIPNQFCPLDRPGVQTDLCAGLQSTFDFVGAIPYRRNITFVAGRSKPKIRNIEISENLLSFDKAGLLVGNLKVRDLSDLPRTKFNSDISLRSFHVIDIRMHDLWREVITALKRYDVYLGQPRELLQFVQDVEAAPYVLDRALEEGSELLLSTFPILAAGESHLHPLKLDWLFQWAAENSKRLQSEYGVLYRQLWLPQLLSMVLQSSGRYKHHYFQVSQLMQAALREGRMVGSK
jgi:hypothetical protein